MRLLASALSLALGSLLLAACSGGRFAPTAPAPGAPALQSVSVIPQWVHFATRSVPQRPIVDAGRPKTGLYAGEFYGVDVLGYRTPNSHNHAAICRRPAEFVNGLRVDDSGNLVVPSGVSPAVVDVYRGPRLCGKLVASFVDKYGQAGDAATENALSGTIVVANVVRSNGEKIGSISICTLKKGCTRQLKSPKITYVGGSVALAKNGDCWMTSENDASLSGATLTYFKRCSGRGKKAKGWRNAYYGGLVVDKHGFLISVDFATPALWVYKGCDPKCKRIGGPFDLEGASFYGGLNKAGDELALGDYQFGQVDVYRYAPKKLTYEYSFNDGLATSENVEGAVFSPAI